MSNWGIVIITVASLMALVAIAWIDRRR